MLPSTGRRRGGGGSLRVVVCVKQVLILGDEVEFSADGLEVDPAYFEAAVNEWDLCAVEEALRIGERAGDGEVVVVSAGDQRVEAALQRCLAMGADRAIRVETGVADPVSVGLALADVIGPEEPDLVLAGVQSSDSVQAATGTIVAELLGLPRVAVVTKVDWAGSGPATVHRELEGGLIDVVEVDTPALLTIQTGINKPRYANLRAIKQAERMDIPVHRASDGTPCYRVRRMFAPPKAGRAEMLEGSPAEIAARIAEIVRERLSA